jgi:hypothetical protein
MQTSSHRNDPNRPHISSVKQNFKEQEDKTKSQRVFQRFPPFSLRYRLALEPFGTSTAPLQPSLRR